MQKSDLETIVQQNDLIAYAYSHYLNRMPRLLSAEMVTDLARDCGIDNHAAFLSLFAAACGLEPDVNREHRLLEREYIQSGVRRLDPAIYENDPYYRTVRFSEQSLGRWEMKESFYTPFEPFVWTHPTLTDTFREIPQIGYFDREFRFPAILENGVEWMTVTPNEVETMREPIAQSHGRVLTLGLGLGYFAFSAAEKHEVTSVTVLERDPDVIHLFREHILPQFPNAQKIEIIEADALEYMQNSPTVPHFDYIFADLWHDQSDGLPLYLQLCRIARERGLTNIDYWIEPTLLSSLRHMVYEKITDPHQPLQLRGLPIEEFLSDGFLKKLAPDVKAL